MADSGQDANRPVGDASSLPDTPDDVEQAEGKTDDVEPADAKTDDVEPADAKTDDADGADSPDAVDSALDSDSEDAVADARITSYNVCYTKLLRSVILKLLINS